MSDVITLTRQELYELAWQKPISTLARELALSDVGLTKLCGRYDIPTPPRGYWARLKSGMNPKVTKLPPWKEGDDLRIRFRRPEQQNTADALSVALEGEESAENAIIVPERLSAPSPLIVAARTILDATKVGTTGLLESEKECLDVLVSPAQLPRALRILDALLKAFASRDWKVTVEGDKTLVLVAGVALSLSVHEALDSIELPVKPQPRGSDYTFNYNRRGETVQKPSGALVISIQEQESIWGQSARRNWRDTEKHRLEAQLNKLTVGMLRLAGIVQVHRDKRAREEHERNERKRQLEDAQREQTRLRGEVAAEKGRVELLRSQAARWRESEGIRAFVAQARERGDLHEQGLDSARLTEWCDWALRQADRLDPFVPTPASIIDDAERIEHMCDSFRGYW